VKEETADDLRATAENLVDDAERLQAIERRKLELEPEATETHLLATKAERLAEDMLHKARAEKQLAEEIAEEDSTS
jgi:hypothetical protein